MDNVGKKVLYRKVQIETKHDLFDHDDRDYEFTSVESALVRAFQLSRDLECVAKLVDCLYYENGDYKRSVIATINYSSVRNRKVYE